MHLKRPLVLVHGLWNTPSLFNRLKERLNQPDHLILSPHLPHKLGKTSLRGLAIKLDSELNQILGHDIPIDILGFSMGGVISRIWIQEMNGFKRTQRFFSVGSPHKGTITAQMVPAAILPGIADMKIGSQLNNSLNCFSENLKDVECRSYFTYSDLMVFPGYRAVLPYGISIPIPVLTHKCLIKHSISVELLSEDLLR